MVIVGLPYAYQGQMAVDEIRGGSPYGAGTMAGGDGSRMPSKQELESSFVPRQACGRSRRWHILNKIPHAEVPCGAGPRSTTICGAPFETRKARSSG